MNIYLDIDGVLLANEENLAIGASEFIKYAANNFDVYWLTTHCNGDASVPLQHIGHLFDDETVELAKKVVYLARGIDFFGRRYAVVYVHVFASWH